VIQQSMYRRRRIFKTDLAQSCGASHLRTCAAARNANSAVEGSSRNNSYHLVLVILHVEAATLLLRLVGRRLDGSINIDVIEGFKTNHFSFVVEFQQWWPSCTIHRPCSIVPSPKSCDCPRLPNNWKWCSRTVGLPNL
jgi:hypothetical protein